MKIPMSLSNKKLKKFRSNRIMFPNRYKVYMCSRRFTSYPSVTLRKDTSSVPLGREPRVGGGGGMQGTRGLRNFSPKTTCLPRAWKLFGRSFTRPRVKPFSFARLLASLSCFCLFFLFRRFYLNRSCST